MGRINIEIPEDLHQQLRTESAVKNVPIKMVVIRALREHCDEQDFDVDENLLN